MKSRILTSFLSGQKRRTTVKRIFSVSLALAVSAILVIVMTTSESKHGVRAVYAQSGCTVATLNANYAFTDSGWGNPRRPQIGPEVPVAVVGVLGFDGAGNSSLNFTLAFNGSISPPLSNTGTYTVNSDCTGSISFTAGDIPINFNMVIIGGGTEVFGMVTSTGNTQTWDAKKQ